MVEDSELLELAAQAIGLQVTWVGQHPTIAYTADERAANHGIDGYGWNPLAYDGDALRLAVKLRLRVDCYDDQVETADGCEPYKIGRETFTNTFVCIEGVGEDKMAATRRAIVRAAAEISIRAKDTPK